VRAERDAVSDQDVALLLKNATKPSLRSWLALIAFQGLRPQEVADLRKEDVDLRTRPHILTLGGNEMGAEKTAIMHPEVEGALRSLDLPDRGRLFPTAIAKQR
jgi:integrase